MGHGNGRVHEGPKESEGRHLRRRASTDQWGVVLPHCLLLAQQAVVAHLSKLEGQLVGLSQLQSQYQI